MYNAHWSHGTKRLVYGKKKFACLAPPFLITSYGRPDERIARQTRVLDFHLLAEPGGSAEGNKIIDVASVSIELAPHHPIHPSRAVAATTPRE